MNTRQLEFGVVNEDNSGLLHYKSHGGVDISKAAEDALSSRSLGRPIWFWYDEYFCPIPNSNCTHDDLAMNLLKWQSDFKSDPQNLIDLLKVKDSSEILAKDTCGIWHYRMTKKISANLQEAAVSAVTEPKDPEDVTFFWYDEFVCPIRHNDTADTLASRWDSWHRAFCNYRTNILWLFQNLL